MRTVLIMCALCGVACGGADSRPADDPSTVGSTSSMAASPSGGGASVDPAPAQGPSSATPASTTPNALPGGADNTSSSAPSTQTTPNANAPAPRGDAVVANNPGAADQTKNADNTKMNERDRHDALTPMNQGNKSDEIKISAAIRKGIVGDKSLSFMAKNVKVITQGTKVTLRGPVHSDQEKAAIEEHARQTPGVTDVDDQLEVKK